MRYSMLRFLRSMLGMVRILAIGFSLTLITTLMMTSPTQAAIVHVNHASTAGSSATGTTWALAFEFLADGLANADPGDEVWVAAGEYRPDQSLANPTGTGNRATAFALKKGVAVYGGYAGTETSRDQRDAEFHDTILSGDLAGDDDYGTTGFLDDPPDYSTMAENSYHVCTAISTTGQEITDTTILDSCIVKGGNANGSTDETKRGAGLYCGGADIDDVIDSSPTVTQTRFEFNRTEGGYAAAVYSSYGDAVLRDLCHFENNHSGNCGGAIILEKGGTITVLGSHFQNNRAASRGGAIQVGNVEGHAVICSSTFIQNQATADSVGVGGALHLNGRETSIVLNCVLRANSSLLQAGAAYLNNTNVIGSTFVANSATSGSSVGGGITAINNVTVTGSILWNNASGSTSALADQISGTYTASYSDIQTGAGDPSVVTGTGNINADPAFKSTTDLRLTNCSPCIDVGLNGAVPLDEFDLDDDGYIDTGSFTEATPDADIHDRILNGNSVSGAVVDMGAYEFDPDCPADLNASAAVNGTDLAILLGDWTGNEVVSPCPSSDLSDDCRVNGIDLAILLGMWGSCQGICGGSVPMGFGGGEEEDGGAIAQLVAWYLAGDMAAIIQWLIEQGY